MLLCKSVVKLRALCEYSLKEQTGCFEDACVGGLLGYWEALDGSSWVTVRWMFELGHRGNVRGIVFQYFNYPLWRF